jgi:BirA family biotin operon repressor/biotin-[acetyl-CoA-carboxylase] ligase
MSSTQDFAYKIVKRKKKINPSVVICNVQNNGKGREGSFWSSPEGGIWVSIFMETSLKLENLFLFTMISSLCICETIEKETGLKPHIKWPNDIFVNGKKIAGILLDAESNADLRKNTVILGMGINTNNDLNLTTGKIPKKYQNHYQLTTIKEEAKKPNISNVHFLSTLLSKLSHYFSKIEGKPFVKSHIFDNYQRRIMESKDHLPYSFKLDDVLFEGVIVNVDADGSLLVRDNQQQKILKITSANCVNLNS